MRWVRRGIPCALQHVAHVSGDVSDVYGEASSDSGDANNAYRHTVARVRTLRRRLHTLARRLRTPRRWLRTGGRVYPVIAATTPRGPCVRQGTRAMSRGSRIRRGESSPTTSVSPALAIATVQASRTPIHGLACLRRGLVAHRLAR